MEYPNSDEEQATSVNADAYATATGDVIGQLIMQQSATADIWNNYLRVVSGRLNTTIAKVNVRNKYFCVVLLSSWFIHESLQYVLNKK